jgi:hypothetical protein
VLTFNEPFKSEIHPLSDLYIIFSNVELIASSKNITGLGLTTWMIGTRDEADRDDNNYMVDLLPPTSPKQYFSPNPV